MANNPYKKGDRIEARNASSQTWNRPRRGTVFSDPIQNHGVTVEWDGDTIISFIRLNRIRRPAGPREASNE